MWNRAGEKRDEKGKEVCQCHLSACLKKKPKNQKTTKQNKKSQKLRGHKNRAERKLEGTNKKSF